VGVIRIGDEKWNWRREHIPKESIPDDDPGCELAPARKIFDAALWILNTSSQWHMLFELSRERQFSAPLACGEVICMDAIASSITELRGMLPGQLPPFVQLAAICIMLKRIHRT
jgi:hypothetical protein